MAENNLICLDSLELISIRMYSNLDFFFEIVIKCCSRCTIIKADSFSIATTMHVHIKAQLHKKHGK